MGERKQHKDTAFNLACNTCGQVYASYFSDTQASGCCFSLSFTSMLLAAQSGEECAVFGYYGYGSGFDNDSYWWLLDKKYLAQGLERLAAHDFFGLWLFCQKFTICDGCTKGQQGKRRVISSHAIGPTRAGKIYQRISGQFSDIAMEYAKKYDKNFYEIQKEADELKAFFADPLIKAKILAIPASAQSFTTLIFNALKKAQKQRHLPNDQFDFASYYEKEITQLVEWEKEAANQNILDFFHPKSESKRS